MKRIFSSVIFFLILQLVKGQVTFNPAAFTALDSVTLVVDASNTPMAGESEAYIWIFAFKQDDPNGPATNGIVNGTWTSSSPAAKLKNLGGNKWQFGFTSGSVLFGLAPADLIHGFGLLLKTKDGGKQTANFQVYKFDALIFTPTVLRAFPTKADITDVITINFDQTLSNDVNEQRMTPATATVGLYKDDASGPIQVGSDITLPVRKTADRKWAASFIPSSSFTIPTGTVITRFRYKFHGTVLDASGAPMNVTSLEGEQTFTSLK